MKADTTATLLRLNVAEYDDYALTLPIKNLHEYFLAMDWLEDFLAKDYITIELVGAFDFLLYEENLDLELFNKLLLRFQQLDEDQQETVLWLTHLSGDTISALNYALINYTKYLLIPTYCKNESAIAKYVINKVYPNSLLELFEDAICFEDFCECLFRKQIAFSVDNRILVKIIELLE